MSLYFLLSFIWVLTYNEVGGRSISKATRFSDIYDGVDSYKKPPFDRPILMQPSFRTGNVKRCILANKEMLKRKGYSVGTFPMSTKDACKTQSIVTVKEPSGTYVAGVRTKSGSSRYSGGGMTVSVYNPRTMPGAYSLARIKISSGPDAIQFGWRVDPSLRGDNLTRLFIYTETNSSRCFDAHCGFIIVNATFLPDDYFDKVSQPGVIPNIVYKFSIIRDPESGNWWLVCGYFNKKVGFWPKNIFTGLGELATSVEWAGEVYSPPGVFEPLMGSGYRPSVGDTKYVAYFSNVYVLDENNTYSDAYNVEEFATDRSLYDVKDEGYFGEDFKHLVFFGGARY